MAVNDRLLAEDVSVRFGDRRALDGVTVKVAAGEVVCVLGPSGSGKSTLLRAVAGLQALDGGRIVLDGRDLAPIPTHERGVGLMFQDHALFPHRDVAGNVGFGLRMLRRPPAEVRQRVGELLELVGLPGTGRRAVQTLSGGEQQRVALARALAPGPRVLLLDEPLGSLDRALRQRLVTELATLFGAQGQTVVAVTHDRDEAFALAHRIVVMDAGVVLQAGPPDAVWDEPVSRRVAELLGLANLADVVVRDGVAQTPWGPVPMPAPDGPATVLVRGSSISLDPAGAITGRVLTSTFQGDRVALAVQVDGGAAPESAPESALELRVPHRGAPGAGSRVRLAIDPAGVTRLSR